MADRWRRDGKELFYTSADDKIVAVPVTERGDSIEVRETRALFSMSVMFPTTP